MLWSRIVAKNACIIIISVLIISCALFVIAVYFYGLPSFDDPLLGFEVRGTEISQRINSWKLLLSWSSWSGTLSLYPYVNVSSHSTTSYTAHTSSSDRHNGMSTSSTIDEENVKQIESIESPQFRAKNHNLSKNNRFCGKIYEDYAHIIVETIDASNDLLSLKSVKELCEMDRLILRMENSVNYQLFSDNCEHKNMDKCCMSWSIANYIAVIANKSSCDGIDQNDISKAKHYIYNCAHYYYNMQLNDECDSEPVLCRNVPKMCLQFGNAMFDIMHYLVDYQFLNPDYHNSSKLKYTSIFLPIAKSTELLSYFNKLSQSNLNLNDIRVAAMDLGLKNSLFDNYLLHDTIYLIIALFIILISLYIYTSSLLITFITLTTIASSLGTAYFFYKCVFRLSFFPFMNLMSIVIAIGIGSDNTLIYCKVWKCAKSDKSINHKTRTFIKLIEDTMNHAWVSVLAASATTCAAFFAAYFSNITSIKCFSVFAGTAVISNFIITMLSLPPAVVIADKSSINYFNNFTAFWRLHSFINSISKAFFEKIIFKFIVKFRYFWIIFFGGLALCSVVIVVYKPKLQLPDSEEFQLFNSRHYFEKYDFEYKEKFWFKRAKHNSNDLTMLMPIRVVFGIKPIDNGDLLNPLSRGSLQFSHNFDISSKRAQTWLLKFCREIRNQTFYKPTIGPLLSNCFIETFKSWMDDRRCDDSVNSNSNRTPCCQTSVFPYEKHVFDLCLRQAIQLLHKTPKYLLNMDWAGPRFDKNSAKISAIVIEYDSIYSFSHSFIEMDKFWHSIDDWVSEKMLTAPNEMQNGWFISHHLEFYALQECLARGTTRSIYFAVIFSFLALLLTTWNLKLSLLATTTISCIIFTTIGVLVMLHWKLNVLESITISLAIGLAIDLTLHYTIAFKLSMQDNNLVGVHYALCKIGSPVAMASLTTSFSGILMLLSSTLAYVQIGTFLLTLAIISWIYSTIFHLSLLIVFGPKDINSRIDPLLYCCLLCNDSNQTPVVVRCSTSDSISSDINTNKKNNGSILQESTLSSLSPTNSTTFHSHNHLETHELEFMLEENTAK